MFLCVYLYLEVSARMFIYCIYVYGYASNAIYSLQNAAAFVLRLYINLLIIFNWFIN